MDLTYTFDIPFQDITNIIPDLESCKWLDKTSASVLIKRDREMFYRYSVTLKPSEWRAIGQDFLSGIELFPITNKDLLDTGWASFDDAIKKVIARDGWLPEALTGSDLRHAFDVAKELNEIHEKNSKILTERHHANGPFSALCVVTESVSRYLKSKGFVVFRDDCVTKDGLRAHPDMETIEMRAKLENAIRSFESSDPVDFRIAKFFRYRDDAGQKFTGTEVHVCIVGSNLRTRCIEHITVLPVALEPTYVPLSVMLPS